MTAVRELLPVHALGALDADEAGQVERAVADDPELAAELDALTEASAALAVAVPAPEGGPPPPALRERLLASIAAEASPAPGRFARFVDKIGQLLDVTVERARELLGLIDDPAAWQPGPGPGTWLIHFEGGPACAGADTGFVKVDPGATFPWHHHIGAEDCLVLDGAAHDSAAGRLTPGDEPACSADTDHDFRALGDRPFLLVVRVFGVDFDVEPPA